MKKLSIVGKDYHTEEHVVGYYTTGDRMLYWGKLGAFWGGFWGLLLAPRSSGCRALVNCWWRDRSSSGSSARSKRPSSWVGSTALGAALYSIGIPKNSVMKYETEVKNGKLLLVVHGSPRKFEHAKDLLNQTQATETTVHAKPAAVGV